VGPRAVLDGWGKSRPHRDSILEPNVQYKDPDSLQGYVIRMLPTWFCPVVTKIGNC